MVSSGSFIFKDKKDPVKEVILFVEGKDDANFFDCILSNLKADPDKVLIINIDGKDKLDKNLSQLTKSRPFIEGRIRKLAIVQDADASGAAALRNLQQTLRSHSLACPGQGSFATIAGSPEVGVFVLPSDQAVGDLERICLETIADDPKLIRVCEFFAEIQERFGALDRTYKRQAAIFLACSAVETRGVGQAFGCEGIFNRDHACLDDIKSFVRQLIA